MYKLFVVLSFLLIGTTVANAATWNGFQHAFNDKSMYFFDVDSVIKKGDSVTFWLKYVKNEKYPDDDGSYSTARKVEYSCKKRTSRALNTSIYDKDRQFIKSYGASDKITDIAPDTIGEAILTAVCTSDFPKSKSNKQYFQVVENDIYRHTANFYKDQEESKIDLAPNPTATWNGFSYAVNERYNYYFAVNSVIKKGDIVALWIKGINNEKFPDEDGSYSTAQKVELSCSNNTLQALNTSIYNKEGQFIRSYSKPEKIVEIKPNTINHAILTAVCSQDFPISKSKEQYFPVEGNDIYGDAAKYFRSQEEKHTDLAPK